MKSIPFKILEYHGSYTSQVEGLNIIETEETIIANICESFPTPGYSVSVNKVVKEDEDFIIYLNIIAPKPDAILLQVITYIMVSIEISKKDLGDPPYKFKLAVRGFKRSGKGEGRILE